jgi:3-hydroxyisobutyrate dehydrogenase-like beta-hydroxyacid dehydrogenase
MGYPMAMNIRKKMSPTKTLFITDVYKPALEKFVAQAAAEGWGGPVEIMDTAKAVAEYADTIFSIVPAATHVKQVYLDPETGIMAAGKKAGRLCIECSTIDVTTTREVGKTLKAAGVAEYVDSPVSVRPFPCHYRSMICLKTTSRAACQEQMQGRFLFSRVVPRTLRYPRG